MARSPYEERVASLPASSFRQLLWALKLQRKRFGRYEILFSPSEYVPSSWLRGDLNDCSMTKFRHVDSPLHHRESPFEEMQHPRRSELPRKKLEEVVYPNIFEGHSKVVRAPSFRHAFRALPILDCLDRKLDTKVSSSELPIPFRIRVNPYDGSTQLRLLWRP